MKWLWVLLLFSSCAVAQVTQVAHGGTAQSSYAKGDLLCPSGSTTMTKLAVGGDTQVLTADSTQTCGIKWAATSGTGVLGYSASAVTVTANTYFFPVVGGSLPSTTETNVDTEAPVASTIQNLYVSLSSALGTGNAAVFTYRKNASDQTLTCTISGASATSCNDTTHAFSVAAGDLITIKVVTTGTIVVSPNIIMTASYGGGSGGGASGYTKLCTGTISSSTAALKFDASNNCSGADPFSSTYAYYHIACDHFTTTSTSNAQLAFRVSTTSGSYDSGTNYGYSLQNGTGSGFNQILGANSGQSSIVIATNTTTGTNDTLGASMEVYNPSSSTTHKVFIVHGGVLASDSNWYESNGAGRYLSNSAVLDIEFIFTAGNIATGTCTIWGLP